MRTTQICSSILFHYSHKALFGVFIAVSIAAIQTLTFKSLIINSELKLTSVGISCLNQAWKWTYFLSVVGFVFTAIIVIAALFFSSLLPMFSGMASSYGVSEFTLMGTGMVTVSYLFFFTFILFFQLILIPFFKARQRGNKWRGQLTIGRWGEKSKVLLEINGNFNGSRVGCICLVYPNKHTIWDSSICWCIGLIKSPFPASIRHCTSCLHNDCLSRAVGPQPRRRDQSAFWVATLPL